MNQVDKWIYNLNLEPDYKLCNSLFDALKSDAAKLCLILILRNNYSHIEADELHKIFIDFINHNPINKEDLTKLEKKVLDWKDVFEGMQKFIKWTIIVPESVEKHSITAENLILYFRKMLSQSRIDFILNDWNEEEKYKMSEKLWEEWNIIFFENEKFCIYKNKKSYFLMNKENKEVKEIPCDKIEYDEKYWFLISIVKDRFWSYTRKTWWWIKDISTYWILNKNFKLKIPIEYLYITFIEGCWFQAMKWTNHWVIDENNNELIPFEYDFIHYNKKYWFLVNKWEKYWIISKDFKEILPCKYKEYDFKFYEDEKWNYFEVPHFIPWKKKKVYIENENI